MKIEEITEMPVCLMVAYGGNSTLTRQVVEDKTSVHYNMLVNKSFMQEKSLAFVVMSNECFTETDLANDLLFPGQWGKDRNLLCQLASCAS